MLEIILNGTKILSMFSASLFSALIVNVCIKYVIKQLQFSEVFGALFKKLNDKKEGREDL